MCIRDRIVYRREFRSGVALEGQQGVVAHHAAAVVGDPQQTPAAGLDLDADVGGAGVEGVFEKLLDYRGGALDDFAGGDLIGDLVGENSNAAHGSGDEAGHRLYPL